MKKILLMAVLICTIASAGCLTSCKGGKETKQKADSIALVNSSLQAQVEEMDQIISGILTNFQDINAMEGIINTGPISGEIGESHQRRIEDNMRMIGEKLKSNREEIEQLNKKIKDLGQKGSVLQKTISALQKQLESKTKEIQRLTEELQRKNIVIENLDAMVGELSENVSSLEVSKKEQEEKISSQEVALNTVRYCVGTKNDLKEMKILVDGKVATESYTKDYFTQIDLRRLSRLPLYAKKAELLTNHPSSSYELVPGADKQLTLEITNKEEFWSLSKVLVVRIY
ncbi:hypothetical protein [Porphyromonas circumdentaria]|uniref:Cbp1 family collagen-binding glycoprotein adhesin n=1 Tax=Porphyromonas circumdentaria TaxID=29524 RepID=UPI0026DB4916|nr:hypothetical protein [Porphyromonas circumdentaria]MDO4722192.1 hypothetical protein [Porphyromonas circumdentaria]